MLTFKEYVQAMSDNISNIDDLQFSTLISSETSTKSIIVAKFKFNPNYANVSKASIELVLSSHGARRLNTSANPNTLIISYDTYCDIRQYGDEFWVTFIKLNK